MLEVGLKVDRNPQIVTKHVPDARNCMPCVECFPCSSTRGQPTVASFRSINRRSPLFYQLLPTVHADRTALSASFAWRSTSPPLSAGPGRGAEEGSPAAFSSIARCLQRLLSCVFWLSGLESALTVGTCEPSDDNVNLSLVWRRGQKEERPWADACWPRLENSREMSHNGR
jgi:hypothetical protein